MVILFSLGEKQALCSPSFRKGRGIVCRWRKGHVFPPLLSRVAACCTLLSILCRQYSRPLLRRRGMPCSLTVSLTTMLGKSRSVAAARLTPVSSLRRHYLH